MMASNAAEAAWVHLRHWMDAVDPVQRVRLQLNTAPLPQLPDSSEYGRVVVPPEIVWHSGDTVAFDHVVVWDAAPEFGHCDRYIEQADETTAGDSLDCSSSNGARWSDLMARIDDLIE